VIGHRGAGGTAGYLAPEDTLSAYRAAIALGIEFAETDPRPTADGVLVNVHDTTVDRTTTGTGQVSRMTLAEVQALSLRSDDRPGQYDCERIPTLREVLSLCRGRITVVVDANKTDRVDLLVGDILATDTLGSAVFSTSDLDKVVEALRLAPGLRVHIRPRSVAEIAAQLAQLHPVVPVIVELGRGDVRAGAAMVRAAGARVSTNVFVEDVLAATTGDLSAYVTAFRDGASFVQSDRPAQVLEALRAAGLR